MTTADSGASLTPLAEIRVTSEQLEELKTLCVGNPDKLPMWPAIMGLPVIVDPDPANSILADRTWQDVYDQLKERTW